MKEKLLAISKSLAVLCICTILFSLIFAALYYFQIISQSMFHILNWIFGVISFLAAGILLGFWIKKKALLHALILLAIFAVAGFLCMGEITPIRAGEFLSKLLAYAIGCALIALKRKD